MGMNEKTLQFYKKALDEAYFWVITPNVPKEWFLNALDKYNKIQLEYLECLDRLHIIDGSYAQLKERNEWIKIKLKSYIEKCNEDIKRDKCYFKIYFAIFVIIVVIGLI